MTPFETFFYYMGWCFCGFIVGKYVIGPILDGLREPDETIYTP